MKKEYDLSRVKFRKNPYASLLVEKEISDKQVRPLEPIVSVVKWFFGKFKQLLKKCHQRP